MNIIIEKNKPKRYEFIDILRGLSVLWMIEAHITDVVLWPAAKSTFLFYLIDKSNGFVATTFLFCAGAGFYISTSRKFDDFKNFRKPLWIYLRKLAFILFIAFSMHLPTRDFFQLFSLTNDQLVRFVECDILQTIVYSSLIALVLFFIIPNLKYLKFVSIVIALVAYYATSLYGQSIPLIIYLHFLLQCLPNGQSRIFQCFLGWDIFLLALLLHHYLWSRWTRKDLY